MGNLKNEQLNISIQELYNQLQGKS